MNNSFSNQQPSSRSWVFNFLVLVSLIVSLIGGYFFSNLLKIAKVSSPHKIDPTLVNDLKSRNLFLLDKNKVQETISKSNPLITEITLEKRYPNELHISYTQTKPLAQIFNKRTFLVVDAHGKVLSQQSKPNHKLKSIEFYQQLRNFESKKGSYLTNPDILYALSLCEKLNKTSLSVISMKIEKPNVLHLNEKDQQIYLSTKKQIDKNLIIVQNINKTFKIKGSKPKIVNLLFEKAIVTL